MVSSTSRNSARSRWTKVRAIRKFLSLAHAQSTRAPAQLLVQNRFRIGKKIANGAFGQVRLGLDLHNNRNVAIKLEPKTAILPMLSVEYDLYRLLRAKESKNSSIKGFPKVHYYGDCGPNYRALVMELLGPSLEEVFRANNRCFSLPTILCIALQLLERLELIHQKGIVYRDVKPENFLLGLEDKGLIHVVDFGLAKMYLDPDSGKHVNFDYTHSLAGTMRYMSINAHLGKQQSRRDDLESLGYVLFYFLSNANLPWQGIKCEDGQRRNQLVLDKKTETTVETLAKGVPSQFAIYLHYCQTLHFDQKPDYHYLKELFKTFLYRLQGGNVDWGSIKSWSDNDDNNEDDKSNNDVSNDHHEDLVAKEENDEEENDEEEIDNNANKRACKDESDGDEVIFMNKKSDDKEEIVEELDGILIKKRNVGVRHGSPKLSLTTRPEMINVGRNRDAEIVAFDACCVGFQFRMLGLGTRKKRKRRK